MTNLSQLLTVNRKQRENYESCALATMIDTDGSTTPEFLKINLLFLEILPRNSPGLILSLTIEWESSS